ncbi:MAG: ATP-binding protein [bacterium]
MKIVHKLFLAFFIIIVLFFCSGYLFLHIGEQALRNSIQESSLVLANELSMAIDRGIYQRIQEMQSFSWDVFVQKAIKESNQRCEESGNIKEYSKKITPFMQEMIDNELGHELRKKIEFYPEKEGYSVYGEIFITNKYGATIAMTGKTSEYYQADKTWWKEAKKDGLSVGDLEYDKSAGIYSLSFGIRADDDEGNFIGIIKSVYNIQELVNIIKKYEKSCRVKGRAAHVYKKLSSFALTLITQDGKIIYSTEGHKIFENIFSEEFKEKLYEDNTWSFIGPGDTPSEGDKLFIHVHSEGFKDYKGLGWILITEHETDVIYAPISRLKSIMAGVFFVSLICALLVCFSISRSISMPIATLKEAMQQVGNGKLDTKIDNTSHDEFSHLAATFGKMAEDLKRTTTHTPEMLRAEKDKLQALLNAIGEAMHIVNQDFIIEYQNEMSKSIFPHAIGKKCYIYCEQSYTPCEPCIMKDVIKKGKRGQYEINLPDGRSFDMTCSSFTEMDGGVKAIILLRDITEKKFIQAETMRIGHLAAMGELAAGVAHEINNPVNGIISYAEILIDQGEGGNDKAEILSRIIKEGDRIAKIVKNLLSFAQDRGKELSCAHIKDILAETFELVEQHIIKDGITIRIDVPSDLPEIQAHSHEIRQVFLNIISNARYALNQRFPGSNEDKFLEIKGEMIEIEGQGHIRTTFYDSGMGIPQSILDKISDPFFTTKPRGEGTGLGLSISQGIIKNHGGRLWFRSSEGEYTKVMVDLPVTFLKDREHKY